MGIPLATVTEQLVRLAPHMQLAHHIPGRIRLRIHDSGMDTAREIDIHEVARSVPGIKGIRLNPFNRSVIIEYDSVRFPPDLWNRCCNWEEGRNFSPRYANDWKGWGGDRVPVPRPGLRCPILERRCIPGSSADGHGGLGGQYR